MAKVSNVDKDACVRVQVVAGGTLEMRGIFACQVKEELEARFAVNLDQPGHHVIAVFGGILAVTNQTSLPLNDPDKEKAERSTAAQIVANLAPSDTDLNTIRDALVGKTVQAVEFEEGTGLYAIRIAPAKKKEEGVIYDLAFTNATLRPFDPKKKEPEPAPVEGSATEQPEGDQLPDAQPPDSKPMSEDAYATLIDLAAARAKPHDYNNVIKLALLDVGNQDNASAEFGNNIDRWRWLATVGADDADLLTHIRESFGGRPGRVQVCGDYRHRLFGQKKQVGISYCLDVADKDLPKWCWPGDRDNFHDPKENNLVDGIRRLMKVPGPKKGE